MKGSDTPKGTTDKRLKNLRPGRNDGVIPFTSENQPSPEAKREGWKKVRERRMLTQEIIKMMIGDDGKPKDTFKDYLQSLLTNAKMGNSKAIEAINKAIEDDVLKQEITIRKLGKDLADEEYEDG